MTETEHILPLDSQGEGQKEGVGAEGNQVGLDCATVYGFRQQSEQFSQPADSVVQWFLHHQTMAGSREQGGEGGY